MGKGSLTPSEISELEKNPFVQEVTETRIIYTDEFKQRFMREYTEGKRPTPIFRDAGFDPAVLGPKRIERATARWKKSYAEGRITID